jgi:hypothetical protein
MFGKKVTSLAITVEQHDAAARALFEHATGEEFEGDFAAYENDGWYVLARVALEAAGFVVP